MKNPSLRINDEFFSSNQEGYSLDEYLNIEIFNVNRLTIYHRKICLKHKFLCDVLSNLLLKKELRENFKSSIYTLGRRGKLKIYFLTDKIGEFFGQTILSVIHECRSVRMYEVDESSILSQLPAISSTQK